MTNEEFIESIRLEGEEWRDVVGWEGIYAISNMARIVSLGRYVRGRYSLILKRPKLMKQTVMPTIGYCCVSFSRNNKSEQQLVHRLVAETYLPNPENKPCVDHKDTNRTNNFVDNLRWCSYNENMKNDVTLKTLHEKKSQHSRRTHANPVIATKDGKIIKTYRSVTSVAKDGHDAKRVHLVCSGNAKSHHGYKWMYLSDYETLVKQ